MAEKKKSEFGIGGKLNIFGLEIDLEKLIAGEGIEGLEKLRERLKKLGGKEVLSDEEWKAGGVSVGGHIRTSGIFGEREFDLGVRERETYLRHQIFEYLTNHPEGTRLSELAREFGLARVYMGKILRNLMDENKIEKRDLLYFAKT